MPQFTTFLELTLPEFKEFVNSWHQPVNQNFEEIDDFLQDIHAALVGTGSSAQWASLRGTLANLAARLDVSIEPDGTLDISGSPSIIDLSTSAVRGQFSSPTDRFNDGDFDIFDARQPFVGGRFVPIPTAGPTAGFPEENIDPGMAIRAADFSAKTGRPISSPKMPWSPGLVTGGANPLIAGLGIGQVRISADSPPAVFDIDGYVFRMREIIDLDWNLLTPANNQYVWIYISRDEADYNNANFRYTAPGGGPVATKDLRKLQQGTGTGSTSGSTFTATGTLFNTAAFGKVKAGDTLVITSGPAAGSYVIDALDGVLPDTKFTVRGIFKAASSGVNWHILDNAHPNIGAVLTDTTTTTLPAFAPGRVYIARAQHQSGGNPINIVTFLAGGVYDSGWITVTASIDFPLSLTHNLGQFPTDVEVWFRTGATATQIYEPRVRRQVVTNFDTANATVEPGDVSIASLLFPSAHVHTTDVALTVTLLNATTLPAKPVALFTDSGGTDQTVGQIRVIARR